MDFEHWKKAVVKRVRFRPDRRAIGEELSAHYEDSLRDYLRIGYDEDLARARALRDLGDAEEVGTALDKAHKPLLGWAWYISRAVCVGLMVYLLSCTILSSWSVIPNSLKNYRPTTEPWEFSALAQDDLIRPDNTLVTLAAEASGTRFTRAGYEFSVPYAALWRLDYQDAGSTAYSATILLRIEDDRFWDREPVYALQDLVPVDDEGREYASYENYYWEEDTTTEEARARWDGNLRVNYAGSATPFTRDVWLEVHWFETIPQWLEVTCNTGAGFSFRLDWEVKE